MLVFLNYSFLKMLHEFVNFIVNFASSMWYTWIFFMMVLESSFIPFPSEVAMIPAWYLASLWQMNFLIAFLVWTVWALVWASINYIIWYFLGWEKLLYLIKRFWKYFFISEKHYHVGERYFKKHWMITVFLARFIPAIRQLISLPAWVFRINFSLFLLFTGLGAWIWNLVLMYIWYIAWKNQELIVKYSHVALFIALIAIIFIWLVYHYVDKYFERKYKEK